MDDTSRISFMPFYTEIENIFKVERIIPTRTGYTYAKNAYWAAVPYLAELFSDAQLATICGNPDAKWAFVSLGRDEEQRNDYGPFPYIDSIVVTGLQEEHLVKGRYADYRREKKDIHGIDADFIEHQRIEWLFKFYKWLSETAGRTALAKTAPIFLDQDKKAATAYDDKGKHLSLFLPAEGMTGYRTIHESLLKDKGTCALIQKLGITSPSTRDWIYNTIVPLYKNNNVIDTLPHFKLIFEYYCHQCPQSKKDDFMKEIKGLAFLLCYNIETAKKYKGCANTMYLPTNELLAYFETKPSTRFICYDTYKALVGASDEKYLKPFFIALGVKQVVSIGSKDIPWNERRARHNLPNPKNSGVITYTEPYIDGCKEIVAYIIDNKSREKSVVLWNQLLVMIREGSYDRLASRLKGTCRYFYYAMKELRFDAEDAILLKTARWLMDCHDNLVAPSAITLSRLSDAYNTDAKNLPELISFLSIANPVEEAVAPETDDNLTHAQREKMQYAVLATKYDISPEEAEELFRARATQKNYLSQVATAKVVKDIMKLTSVSSVPLDDTADDMDEDECIPSPVDFSRKVALEKEKTAKAIDRISQQEELQEYAMHAEKYTYRWCKALLSLEILNQNANYSTNKEISIRFARVEREAGTCRILVLKQPDRHIPQFMEDLSDILLQLHFGKQTKSLAIEVANIKSYTLRVKLKSHVDIADLDFSQITEARIDAKSPAFLLDELQEQFSMLAFADDYNMKQNLCENISFIFGPPGTGKTTHLARHVLCPLMQRKEPSKVLVLTPANKSADVLVRKIMEVMNGDTSYQDWLIRFGTTGDATIEQSPIYRDKTFDIRSLHKNITVTTIARFPYDFFLPNGSRIYLNGIHWDYIVIDEASMIPLAHIIYPLYKKTPKMFIIAGDPFQIEPITSVDLWKNENIYTMVGLHSFEKPRTAPHHYAVKLLTTQYRSIPAIGSIFSKFAYGGILRHNREASHRRALHLDDTFHIESLNIIKFPVRKYESIYRCKKLQHSSSYQVYCALFTFEYVSYLANAIAKANQGQFFRIGIIAPYRAQADFIEKLIASEDIPSEIDIQVGTIHGFQGDECDIVFVVFNTPPTITAGKDMFLNKQNIINVSISRAKDYLFIIMPDDCTENINRLHLVKRVEGLIKEEPCHSEMLAPHLEHMMFGSETYLEDNTFSTGHQSVNVYGLPEKRYEIRSEDGAVDIQMHRPIASIAPATNLVHSPRYGEGRIIATAMRDGTKRITVQFSRITETYDAEIAFRNKALLPRCEQ